MRKRERKGERDEEELEEIEKTKKNKLIRAKKWEETLCTLHSHRHTYTQIKINRYGHRYKVNSPQQPLVNSAFKLIRPRSVIQNIIIHWSYASGLSGYEKL